MVVTKPVQTFTDMIGDEPVDGTRNVHARGGCARESNRVGAAG